MGNYIYTGTHIVQYNYNTLPNSEQTRRVFSDIRYNYN